MWAPVGRVSGEGLPIYIRDLTMSAAGPVSAEVLHPSVGMDASGDQPAGFLDTL